MLEGLDSLATRQIRSFQCLVMELCLRRELRVSTNNADEVSKDSHLSWLKVVSKRRKAIFKKESAPELNLKKASMERFVVGQAKINTNLTRPKRKTLFASQ